MGNSGGSIVSNDYSVKGLLRSIGDPGAAPSEKTGATMLKRLDIIDANLDALEAQLRGLDPNVGTRIIKNAGVAAGTTVILHTVTAGKVFYLASVAMSINAQAAIVYANVGIRNVTDVFQYKVMEIHASSTNTNTQSSTVPFLPAIPIPEGYDIYGLCSASVGSECMLTGWEE